MARRDKDALALLVAELREHGVGDYEVERTRRHWRLRFTCDGRRLLLVVAVSTSDRRAQANTRAVLRRMLRATP